MLDLSKIAAHHKCIRTAPNYVPCPTCAMPVRRHEVRTRQFWEPSLHQPTILNLNFGYYVCPDCPEGARSFAMIPPKYRTRAQYDLDTQDAILNLVNQRKTSLIDAAKWSKQYLNLKKLNPSTISDWNLGSVSGRVDPEHHKMMLANFSGQMTVDEMYEDGWCIIRVTDPIQNVELHWTLLDRNANQDDIRKIFSDLKKEGYSPSIVASDGSTLYPGVIAEVWPGARHQRCVFHFIKALLTSLGKAFWAAYKTMPKKPRRKKGKHRTKRQIQNDTIKEDNQSLVRTSRWLIFKNPVNLSDWESERLCLAIHLCPALRTLRALVRELLAIFDSSTDTLAQAEERRTEILDNTDYQGQSAFKSVLDALSDLDLFHRLTAYLAFENAVKTSNHAERENRSHRHHQKVRYRYRSENALRALLSYLHHRPRMKGKIDQRSGEPLRIKTRHPSLISAHPPPQPANEMEVKAAA